MLHFPIHNQRQPKGSYHSSCVGVCMYVLAGIKCSAHMCVRKHAARLPSAITDHGQEKVE